MTHSLKKQIEQMLVEARVDVRAARAEIGVKKRSASRKAGSIPMDVLGHPTRSKGKSYG